MAEQQMQSIAASKSVLQTLCNQQQLQLDANSRQLQQAMQQQLSLQGGATPANAASELFQKKEFYKREALKLDKKVCSVLLYIIYSASIFECSQMTWIANYSAISLSEAACTTIHDQYIIPFWDTLILVLSFIRKP